jgi:hypothetical protein
MAVGVIASLTIPNTSGSQVGADFIPDMFGHPFKKGDIATGRYPKFELSDGANVPYTMLYPSYWSDGSLKRAAFLIRVPSTVAANGSVAVNIKSGTSAPGSSSRSLADLSSGGTDLQVVVTGLDNLSGTWVSSLNQGVIDNDDVLLLGDGPVGKVWRIRQQFMQSGANHGQLECYWYVAALQDANGGLYGIRYFGRVSQPWYNVDTPAKNFRSFSSFLLKNGANTVRDCWANHSTPKAVTYPGSGNNLTVTGHGGETGYLARFTGTTLPNITAGTSYFIYRANANTIALNTNSSAVVDGGSVALSGSASGDATMQLYPYLTHFGSLWTCGPNGKWDYLQAGGSCAAEATVRIVHDKTYWRSTGMLGAYDLDIIPTAQTSYGYELNSMGPIQRQNGGTGERSDLGIMPTWHVRHFLSQSAADEQVTRVTGLMGAHLPVQLYNATTKTVPTVNNTAYTGMPAPNKDLRWRGGSNTSGFTDPVNMSVTKAGWQQVDFDHMPCFAYYPFLLTGEPQYLDLMLEMANQAVQHRYSGMGTSDALGSGYARNGTTNGTTYYGTVIGDSDSIREDAWSLRDLGLVVGVMPANPPQCASYPAYFKDMLEATFAKANNFNANVAPAYYRNNGMMHFRRNGGAHIYDSWQHGYFMMACAQVTKMTESAAGMTLLNHSAKWFSHILSSFSAWEIPHYECTARTGSAYNAPYITDDSQLYFFCSLPNLSWSSATSTFTFTAPLPSGWVPANGDRLMWDGQEGSPPTNLSTFTPYNMVNVTANTFQVAATSGGAPLTLGNSGSGGTPFVQIQNRPASRTLVGDPGQAGFASCYIANTLGATRLAKAAGATVDYNVITALQAKADALGYNYKDEPKYAFVASYESAVVVPAPTGTFTDPSVDGQTVRINFSTTNAPDSGAVTITAVSGGAVSQGPTAATLGSGTGYADFTAVPGTYSYSGTLTNAGGTTPITNEGQFTIAAPVPAPAPTPAPAPAPSPTPAPAPAPAPAPQNPEKVGKHLGYQQITDLSSATALTVPTGTVYALVKAELHAVRWRVGIDPTASVGYPLDEGEQVELDASYLASVKFIEQTPGAKLSVVYFSV